MGVVTIVVRAIAIVAMATIIIDTNSITEPIIMMMISLSNSNTKIIKKNNNNTLIKR